MGLLGCSQRGPELRLRGTLMGNERLSRGSIMMASRGVMRKQSSLSTAPPSIIYMEIRCSSYRLLIYFAYFGCSLYLPPPASALWPVNPLVRLLDLSVFCSPPTPPFFRPISGSYKNPVPPLLLLPSPLINSTPVFFFFCFLPVSTQPPPSLFLGAFFPVVVFPRQPHSGRV